MLRRQRTGSVLCPGCGLLVGVNDARCFTCGRPRPALWGFTAIFRDLGRDLGFTTLVLGLCGILYVSTLAIDPASSEGGGGLALLSPSLPSLLRFGASGALPVFDLGRWWTVLSAPWLHGSLPHILFNMMAVRNLLPPVADLYGPGRAVVVYVLSGLSGALASSAVGHYVTGLPRMLSGAPYTVGASTCILGLIGALLYYGRRGGSRLIAEQARRWALGGLVIGFVIPGVDNWGHLGGLAGGYLVARWLDPLKPERVDHVIAAVGLLVASLAAIVLSVVVDVRYSRLPM